MRLNKEETENVIHKLERCNKSLREFREQMKRVAELARQSLVRNALEIEDIKENSNKTNKSIKKSKKGKKLKNWEKTKFYH